MPTIKEQIRKLTSYSYGGTSAIITNMSLIIGLGSTDVSKSAIIASLLVIALADNVSDSLGIHIYRESEGSAERQSFFPTATNFVTRLLISLVFVLVMVLFPRPTAQILAVIWGLLTITVMSLLIAKRNRQRPTVELLKHIGIAILIIIASRFLGDIIHRQFD